MKIAFATTLSAHGSTVIGRVMPLAHELVNEHDVHVFVLGDSEEARDTSVVLHSVGNEPFARGADGKKRLSGLSLIGNMFMTAWRTAATLRRLKPDVVVIVKPLPANTLGVFLNSKFRIQNSKIILDVDDFELTANKLSSLLQRAAVHWSERMAARMANAIVAASPFLADHFKQLTRQEKNVEMIPTGLTLSFTPPSYRSSQAPVLTYFGSVSISSGHRVDLLPDILAAVHKKYPDAHLLMAGDGDDVATLKNLFTQRDLNEAVEWTGRFTPEDLPELLARTTIVVDPVDASISQRAKSSYRIALATAAGWPVVSSDVGVRPYLLPHDLHNRLFAKPADAQSYTEAIIALLRNPLTESDLAAMQKHAEQFMWEALAVQYTSLL